MRTIVKNITILFSLILVTGVYAEPDTRVIVKIENLAPSNGTFQTPHWVGFHDGERFDSYNGGTPAETLPILGSDAIERLAEDGNTGPISEDFEELVPDGVQATIPGPNGALGPGGLTQESFLLDSTSGSHRFFSYASMIIPSNDFWYANGNPQAHEIFDENGNVVAEDFIVSNLDMLDAGTEVNDEIPENTAFFGQQSPNTGVDEGGVIVDFPDFEGFMPAGNGGILDDPMFRMANFRLDGYPLTKISFATAPAIVENMLFSAELSGQNEVPPVDMSIQARGWAIYRLREDGTRLNFNHTFRRLGRVTAAHLHLAPEGENGPVVVSLLPGNFAELSQAQRERRRRVLKGTIRTGDLTGLLAGQPLDALIAEILDGRIYINIHTNRVPSGEIRGQLVLGK